MFTVYMSTCLTNHKCYVGQAKNLSKRKHAHLKRTDYTDYFHNALRKHGDLNFDWQILGRVGSKPEADNLEKLWISILRTNEREFGYNLTRGGDGSVGIKKTSATRAKLSASLKKAHAEGRFPYGGGWTREHTQETKDKISASLKAKPKLPKTKCTVDGCSKTIHAHGYCAAHNHRFQRYGSPFFRKPHGRHWSEKRS